ncbi:MAG: acyltransferase family protein [Proteobacteria bacterium]|nr:acyltransferase family protein [Pseudomonadota bacterium]
MISQARRADIDGLRAIAILSVMLFHFNANWLPGGFVGVDIFFVISAYLITSHIASAMVDHRFSLANFYVRRIKRIFPASILVFLVAVFLASQLNGLLLPDAKYVLAFIFNMHTSNYFTADGKTNFFLHYWSLSIEEQFYLFWPILLLPLVLVVHGKLIRVMKFYPLILSGLIVGICLILGIKWSMNPDNQADLYFLSIPRFGEMACGALIALLPTMRDAQWVSRLGMYVGVGFLLISCCFMGEKYYPGWRALLPCIGASLLIYCGTTDVAKRTWVNWLLTRRSLLFVGYISYSLYLWHWLVFSVTRFMEGDIIPTRLFIPLFALIFLLSILTYYLVEQPFQRSSAGAFTVFPVFIMTNVLALCLLFSLTGVEALGIPPLIGKSYTNVTVNGQNMRLTDSWTAPCFDQNFPDMARAIIDKQCALGEKHVKPTVLLVGDSHAAALGRFIDDMGKKEGFRATVIAVGACQLSEWGMAHRAPPVVMTPERIRNCNMMLQFIRNNHQYYKAIFVADAFNLFSGNFNVFTKENDGLPTFKLDVLRQIAVNTPIYFFYDEPVIDRSMQKSPLFDYLGIRLGANVISHGEDGNAVVHNLISKEPNFHWVDLSAGYEQFKQDQFIYDDWPVYVDTNHLNGNGARALEKIFLNSEGHSKILPIV